MRILCFDTETTGIPPRKSPTIFTVNNWPYVVQLGFILYDTDKHEILIKQDLIINVSEYGIVIPESSTKIHGITNDASKMDGVPIVNALNSFLYALQSCDMLVAHNIEFDWNMINVEVMRQLLMRNKHIQRQWIQINSEITHYCTMKSSVDICRIESVNRNSGKKYFKYPRQYELHKHLFNTNLTNLHNAFNDVLVCLRCFYKLWYDEDILEISDELKRLFEAVEVEL